MKKKLAFLLIICLVGAVVLFCGCTSQKIPDTPTTSPISSSTTVENPWDYFPTQNGTEWNYKIILSGKPLRYTEATLYPEHSLYCTRDFYNDKGVSTHYLKFKIIGINSNIESSNYDEIKDIEVTEDTLGAFGNNAGVAMAKNDGFISLLCIHKIDVMIPGYSIIERLFFFTGNPGDSFRKEYEPSASPDQLLYLGLDTNVQDGGQKCMHFVRLVEPESRNGLQGHCQLGAEKEFTEDLWFAKGKGLIRLEQKIDGQTSMTWTLEKFIPGP
jgi:hypothetical protein